MDTSTAQTNGGATSPAPKTLDPTIATAITSKLKGGSGRVRKPKADKKTGTRIPVPPADARQQQQQGRSNVPGSAKPETIILAKSTTIDGIDCSGMIDDPKLAGIPVYLQKQNQKALAPEQKAKVTEIMDKTKQADAAKRVGAAKPDTSSTSRKELRKQAQKAGTVVTPANRSPKRKSSDRARYDWAAAREAAAKGKVPAAPDFSANTHRSYRVPLAEVEKLVKARDLAGLQAYRVKGTCSSPSAIKRYREIAIAALKAKK